MITKLKKYQKVSMTLDKGTKSYTMAIDAVKPENSMVEYIGPPTTNKFDIRLRETELTVWRKDTSKVEVFEFKVFEFR